MTDDYRRLAAILKCAGFDKAEIEDLLQETSKLERHEIMELNTRVSVYRSQTITSEQCYYPFTRGEVYAALGEIQEKINVRVEAVLAPYRNQN